MSGAQRGMALLVVLMIIAMMTLITTTSQQYSMQAVARIDSSQAAAQAKWDLLSAERWFLATQSLEEPHSLVHQRQFGDRPVHFALHDRQACFNLNALLPQRAADARGVIAPTAAQQIFLLMLAGADTPRPQAEALMQELIASVKPDPQQEQWRLLDEISQLKALPQVTSALWQQLRPQLCVTPETELKININGLTEQQLTLFGALFANQLPLTQLRELLASRPPQGWKDSSAMTASLNKDTVAQANSLLQSAVVTRSRYFELQLWGEHPTIYAALRSRIEQPDKEYRVTARLYGLSE